MVRALVELHGGRVSVESTIGKGSSFKVELPFRTIENENMKKDDYIHNSKIEMIKFELSDAY